MKKLGFFALGMATLGLYSCSSENATEEQNAEVYQLITDNSDILWFGDYIKDGNLDHSHEGQLTFNSGSISVVDGAVVGGEFELNMNSIKEMNAPFGEEQALKLEGHLKSEDYFNVEKFPTAKILITGSKDGNVQGVLTLKGIDMPFDATMSFKNDDSSAALIGGFELDFSVFKMDGIGGEGEYVSPKIKINVNAEFKK
jgi:polyisoprenoid-binding protein YceI